MASGDATRVWFKEVEATLLSRWRGDMSELAPACATLTSRHSRGLLRMWGLPSRLTGRRVRVVDGAVGR